MWGRDTHFVTDDIVWIWCFDRAGCVHTEGISFIEDLPSFLVLLYALQRLTLEQWGLNARLDGRVREAHLGTLEVDDNGEQTPPVEMPSAATSPVATSPTTSSSTTVSPITTPPATTSPTTTSPTTTSPTTTASVETHPVETSAAIPCEWVVQIGGTSFRLQNDVLHSGLAITGRATVTAKARPKENNAKEYAFKIYWPERTRQKEWDIISEAYKAAGNDGDIKKHLPRVAAYQDFDKHNTKIMRDALGLKPHDEAFPGDRILRVVVFEFLNPITILPGERFVEAWLQCVRCECYKMQSFQTH